MTADGARVYHPEALFGSDYSPIPNSRKVSMTQVP